MNVGYMGGIPTRPQDGIYFTGSNRITRLDSLKMRISSEQKGKHTKWEVIIHKDRIKHNTLMELHPLLILIPDSYKTDRIEFKIAYTHEEAGTIKEQKRIVYLP